MESLSVGWLAAVACTGGLAFGAWSQKDRMGLVGLAVLILSFVLIVAGLFLRPLLIDAVWGTCRTEGARSLIGAHGIVNFALACIGALGVGVVAAKVWKSTRIGGALLAVTAAMLAVPYAYISLFAAIYYPGCFV